MGRHDVFISYSRHDREAARYFATCLAEEGLSVWWDAALHSGESFDQVIERELRAAAAVIVLWSPRSVVSRWVRAEATLADRQGKLVPIIIEQCERPIIFELTHSNDLADWIGDKSDARWKGLLQDIGRLVDEGRVRAAAAAAAGKPRPQSFAAAVPLRREPMSPERTAPPQDEADSQATQYSVGPESLDIFHCLEIGSGERSDQRFIVSPQGLKIGRSAPADVILSDRQVSRSHCVVELDGGVLKITDLGSTNGTFVDGRRVERSAMLPVGSVMEVGTVSLRHQVRSARSLNERKYAVG